MLLAFPSVIAACLLYASRLIIALIRLYEPSARYFLRMSKNRSRSSSIYSSRSAAGSSFSTASTRV
jgi:hypothetical protein